MNKEFTSYSESLELKALGFDEPCFGYYDSEGLQRDKMFWNRENKNSLFVEPEKTNNPKISAPTFAQAFRWFRDNHELPSWIYTSNNKEFFYSILKDGRMIVRDYGSFVSHEEAELACLRKLIEIVKNKSYSYFAN